MNIIDEVEQFKRELRSYEYRKKKIEQINKDLEAIAHRMAGLNSPAFDRIPGTPNVSGGKSDSWYTLMEKREQLIQRRDQMQQDVRFVDSVLSKMDELDAEVIRRVYIKREGIDNVAKDVHYHSRTLYKRMHAAIKIAVTAIEK